MLGSLFEIICKCTTANDVELVEIAQFRKMFLDGTIAELLVEDIEELLKDNLINFSKLNDEQDGIEN